MIISINGIKKTTLVTLLIFSLAVVLVTLYQNSLLQKTSPELQELRAVKVFSVTCNVSASGYRDRTFFSGPTREVAEEKCQQFAKEFSERTNSANPETKVALALRSLELATESKR